MGWKQGIQLQQEVNTVTEVLEEEHSRWETRKQPVHIKTIKMEHSSKNF